MKRMNLLGAIVLLSLVGMAQADSYIETFDNLTPPTSPWQFGGVNEIPATGGNPGHWLHGFGIDTFAPLLLGTPPASDWVFGGDYRSRQVTTMGVDVQVVHVDFPNLGDRPLTLILFNDNHTPANPDDDFAAIYRNANIPDEGAGWASYEYPVPAASTTLPPGWNIWLYGSNAPPGANWNDVITDVTSVGFMYGDPELFYIFQNWDIGMDNARITWVPEPASFVAVAVGALALLRRRY